MEMSSDLLLEMDIARHVSLPSGPKIFAANHPSTIDPAMMMLVSPEPIHMLISETLFKVPVLGRYMSRAGHVTVLNDNGRPALEQAVALLESGQNVGIFTEGAISPLGGGTHRPRTGTVRMALRAGVPVIPVGIHLDRDHIQLIETDVDGEIEVGTWYLRGPYAITVGEPLTFEGSVTDWDLVRALSEDIMAHIVQLSHESARRIDATSARRQRPIASLVRLAVTGESGETDVHQKKKEEPMHHDDLQRLQDLNRCDRDGLIAFLASDRDDKVALWNAWRQCRDYAPLDLVGAALQGAALAEIDLRGVNLSDADLCRAKLDRANLFECQLNRANLTDAHLDGSTLEKTHLIGSDLSRARLASANLKMAQIEEATLDEANLENADLSWARLDAASLINTTLTGAVLVKARLDRARMSRANLQRANLHKATLSYADLTGARLEGATLTRAQLEGTLLIDAHLEQANLSQASMEGSQLRGARLERANLQRARRLSPEQAAEARSLWRATIFGNRPYDGRFNLAADLERAREQRVDTDAPAAMANFYDVSRGAYKRGQRQHARQQASALALQEG
jgi:1-acyl-sn-glycerol-3-phosphate acyltransferase